MPPDSFLPSLTGSASPLPKFWTFFFQAEMGRGSTVDVMKVMLLVGNLENMMDHALL
jgi:hypothetical protein